MTNYNLQQKIGLIQTAKDDIKEAIENKGITPSGNITTYASAIDDIVKANNTSVTITPSTSSQTIRPTDDYTGYGEITVNGVTSSIDANIIASNIRNDVEILGVTGNIVELNGQTKTVSPTTSSQTVVPDSNYNALTGVTVNAVTSSIDNNIIANNIRKDVSILGVTGNIVELQGQTKTINGNGTYTPDSGYNGFTSVSVDVHQEIKRTIINGKYQMPTNSFTFALFNNPTDLGNRSLSNIYNGSTGLTSVNLSSLETISGDYALYNAFANCTNLTSVDLKNLETISGIGVLQNAFYGCTNLTDIDLSNLTGYILPFTFQETFRDCTSLTSVDLSGLLGFDGARAFDGCTSLTSMDLSSVISLGQKALSYTFDDCTSLSSINLSNLTTVSGGNTFEYAFRNCTNLTSVNLSNLASISGTMALSYTFRNCTSLDTLSFPSLTSTGVGNSSTYSGMLQGVTGCTVHFPSNLQSVIGSWSSVTGGFGGTNTTVLFDLPATT